MKSFPNKILKHKNNESTGLVSSTLSRDNLHDASKDMLWRERNDEMHQLQQLYKLRKYSIVTVQEVGETFYIKSDQFAELLSAGSTR